MFGEKSVNFNELYNVNVLYVLEWVEVECSFLLQVTYWSAIFTALNIELWMR